MALSRVLLLKQGRLREPTENEAEAAVGRSVGRSAGLEDEAFEPDQMTVATMKFGKTGWHLIIGAGAAI